MSALRAFISWLHPRWGQMLCFWSGGLLVGGGMLTNFDHHDTALGGAFLIVTGLALKGLAIWRFEKAAPQNR